MWTNNQDELRSILDQSPDVVDRLQSDILLEVPTYDGSNEVFGSMKPVKTVESIFINSTHHHFL